MTGKPGNATPPERRQGAHADEDASLATHAGIGIQFAITIVAFLFLGTWLDGKLGTSPWLTLAGVFLGAGGGFYSLYTRLMSHQRKIEERRKR